MLDNILKREDVLTLLSDIANSNRYNKKENLNSIDYLDFVSFQQSLFTVVDALYKYSVIIDEEKYLKDYIEELNLLIKKIDNYSDINIGINKIITKFVVLKLGYKDKEENRNEILNYVYDKYVRNGYLFHAVSDVYVNDIIKDGFTPQKYNNLYNEFRMIKDILGNDIIESDFSNTDVSFTDSFLRAYYYAINSPIYFYNILCNNELITKEEDRSFYMKNNYEGCFNNLNKIISKLDLNNKKANLLKEVCSKEWNLINRSDYCPTVMVVKRSLLLNDDNDLALNKDIELFEAVGKIISSKMDNIKCNFKIESSDIKFIRLPKYSDLVREEKKTVKNSISSDNNNQYGKVSLLLMGGSLLIAIGVIITMIMIITGG